MVLLFSEDEGLIEMGEGGIWTSKFLVRHLRSGLHNLRIPFGNTPLFESFFGDPNDVVRQMVQTLGKLPEPWWVECTGAAIYVPISMITESQSNSGRRIFHWLWNITLVEHIKDIGTEDEEDRDGKTLNGKEYRLMEKV